MLPFSRRLGIIGGALLLVLVGGVALAARSTGEDVSTTYIVPLVAAAQDGSQASVPLTKNQQRKGAAAQPTPAPTPTPIPPPRSILDTQQILAYYGNPYSVTMGILGEYQGDELVRRVKAQAAKYQELNPDQTVVAALHLVYAVAQAAPGADGTYLTHMPDAMVEELIELTRANGMLFFIDLQNGRANPVAEAEKVQRWMKYENVHLAVDPEFTLGPTENPRDDIGQLDGPTINKIQDLLNATALEAGISNKILIVHQFRDDMITEKSAIAKKERVDVIINMDGWGPPPGKLSKYEQLITNQPVQHAGIKLFYRWDKPMLSEAEVQALTPRPSYVQYQ